LFPILSGKALVRHVCLKRVAGIEPKSLLQTDKFRYSSVQNSKEVRMPFTETNGLKTYYEIHGKDNKRDTIVLLHHGFGCTKMWKGIYPALVENGYRIIMYDRRGYGQSERGTDFKKFYESERFRPESTKELAVLREGLGLDSFHIIGQCEGGVIGSDYSAKYPDHVLSFVTSSTQCYSTIPMSELNKRKFPKPFGDLSPDLRKKLIGWHGKDYAGSS